MSQCVARTKDFERCKNSAEKGSLFCRRHRWWWLITMFGVVVIGTTIGANIATMFGVTFPIPLTTPNFPTLIPSPNPTPTSLSAIDPCGNIKSKVFVGEKVYAANKLDTSLNVRKVPSLSGPIVGSVKNGAEFLVLSGPVCVDDIMWWEATTTDGHIKGWIAEAHSNGTYYILPTK